MARSFVGVGADDKTPLALDPEASFHGTHVAGIAAGNAGTTAPAGADHPETAGTVRCGTACADRQLPRLQRPHARRSRRQHAGDRRRLRGGGTRRHGRDQLLGRRAASRSVERRDHRGGPERLRRRRRPRDLRRQRPRRLRPRLGGLARDRSGRDLRRRALQLTRLRTGAQRHGAWSCRPADPRPVRPHAGLATPQAWANADQQLVDVGTIMGTNGAPVPRDLCGPPGNLDGGTSPLPASSLTGAIALVSRGNCTFALEGRARACRRRDRHRPRRQPAGRGERRSDPARRPRRDDRRHRRLRAALLSREPGRSHGDPDRPGARRSSTRAAAASSPASRPVG